MKIRYPRVILGMAMASCALAQIPAGVIVTAAGTGVGGYSGDGGPATAAQMQKPQGIAFDAAGNLYFCDTGNRVVRRISQGIVSTVVGNGTAGYSGDGGSATSAQLSTPYALAIDSVGSLYIADTGAHVVRKVSGGIITTVAGTGTAGYNGDHIPAASAQLDTPSSIALDAAGNLYIVDALNYRIRIVSGGTISTFAGNGTAGQSGDGGAATKAQIHPAFIAVDAPGTVYITPFPSSTNPTVYAPPLVRKVSAGIISTVAGTTAAPLAGQWGVAINSAGNLVMVDPASSHIWELLQDGTVRAIAGNGHPGFSGDGGPANNAQFDRVAQLAYSPSGDLAFTDDGNFRVRLIHFPGSLAHVVSAGTWDTTITSVNLGPGTAQANVNFYGDSGSPLTLPFTSPQTPNAPAQSVSSAAGSLAPMQVGITDTTGPDSSPTSTGWAQMSAMPGINSFGIFRNPFYRWSAVVPQETRNAPAYLLAYDNTSGLATGVALANLSQSPANVNMILRDDQGNQLAQNLVPLPPQGHTSFMLNAHNSITAGIRGVVEFDSTAQGQISVLGLRAFGNNALTTIPVLAEIPSGGGSITHQTFNGGFFTIFQLVNSGSSAASVTLNFFDDNGNPLPVPLTFPQTGANVTAASVTRNIPANGMLLIQTQAQDNLPAVGGSVQVTTTGSVGGFAIFRWTTNQQEASVPLETRKAGSYVLVFDNTGGISTGLALAEVAGQAASVPVTIRDDSGSLIQTTSLQMPAHGHTAFMLPGTYPAAAGIRGTVEFDTPPGGQISAIGLRATADGTLTTIPVFVK